MHCLSPFFIPLNRRENFSIVVAVFLYGIPFGRQMCLYDGALFTTDSIDRSVAGLEAVMTSSVNVSQCLD